MRQIISKLSNRTLYTFITLLILATGFLIVNAYGTSNPAVVGHSAGEIEEADPTVLASVKDGISWGEISGIPAGFADGVDDAGSTVSSLPWSSITGKPAGFADNVDNEGSSDCKSWTNPTRGGYYLYGYGDEPTANLFCNEQGYHDVIKVTAAKWTDRWRSTYYSRDGVNWKLEGAWEYVHTLTCCVPI